MSTPLLRARGLSTRYPARGARPAVTALHPLDLSVDGRESLGVVGESGAGKSTLVRLLLALERPSAGFVEFAGTRISHLPERRVRPLRHRFQPVFQDPTGSLNGRMRVEDIIAEPLVAHRIGDRGERRRRVLELLEQVGLPAAAATRRPAAFSTGERQRIAIARALATSPNLLLLDEPVAALDRSIQADVLNLLRRLQDDKELAMILVSHDLAVVRALTDRLLVLFAGRVMEEGATAAVLEAPAHPYTRELLAAAPRPDAAWQPPPVQRQVDPKTGCPFRARCPQATSRCAALPPLTELSETRKSACWFADSSP